MSDNTSIKFYARLPFNQLRDQLAGQNLNSLIKSVAPGLSKSLEARGIKLKDIKNFILAGSSGFLGNAVETNIIENLGLKNIKKRTRIANGYLSAFNALDHVKALDNELTLICAMDNLSGEPNLVRNDFVKSLEPDDTELDNYKLDGTAIKFTYADIAKDTVWNIYEQATKKFGFNKKVLDNYAFFSRGKLKAAIEKGMYSDEILPVKIRAKRDGFKEFKSDLQSQFQPAIETYESAKVISKACKLTTGYNVALPSDGLVFILAGKSDKKSIAEVLSYSEEYGKPKDYVSLGQKSILNACEEADLALPEIEIFEMHENHPTTILAIAKEMNLDVKKINPKGGSIGIGDAMAATGGRLITSACSILSHTQHKTALVNISSPFGMSGSVVLRKI